MRKTADSHFYNIHGIEKATAQLGTLQDGCGGLYREVVSKEEAEKLLRTGI